MSFVQFSNLPACMQVFGTRKVFWLMPVFSKEDLERVPALDGLKFPTRSDIDV